MLPAMRGGPSQAERDHKPPYVREKQERFSESISEVDPLCLLRQCDVGTTDGRSYFPDMPTLQYLSNSPLSEHGPRNGKSIL